MSQILESAQTFLLSNARLLERHLFAFLFQQGNRDHIRSALLAYQNADGGFGFWRRGDESWPYVSIHVAHALARAKAKGS